MSSLFVAAAETAADAVGILFVDAAAAAVRAVVDAVSASFLAALSTGMVVFAQGRVAKTQETEDFFEEGTKQLAAVDDACYKR